MKGNFLQERVKEVRDNLRQRIQGSWSARGVVFAMLLLSGTLFYCWPDDTEGPDPAGKENLVVRPQSIDAGIQHGRMLSILGSEASDKPLRFGDPFQPEHPVPGQMAGDAGAGGAGQAEPAKQQGGGAAGRKEGSSPAKARTASPQLQGIIQSEDELGALLLIGGSTYLLAQGENQGNVQVLSITPAGVEVQQGDQVHWFQLP